MKTNLKIGLRIEELENRIMPSSLFEIAYGFTKSSEYNQILTSHSYEEILQRKGGNGEIEFWANYLNNHSSQQTQLGFLNSLEFKEKGNLVNRTYQVILGRIAEKERPEGFEQLSFDVVNSEESKYKLIDKFYKKYLGRQGDDQEIRNWVNVLNDNEIQLVEAAFLSSAEYGNRFNGPRQIITSFYKNLFNRQPDSDGLVSWLINYTGGIKKVNGEDPYSNKTQSETTLIKTEDKIYVAYNDSKSWIEHEHRTNVSVDDGMYHDLPLLHGQDNGDPILITDNNFIYLINLGNNGIQFWQLDQNSWKLLSTIQGAAFLDKPEAIIHDNIIYVIYRAFPGGVFLSSTKNGINWQTEKITNDYGQGTFLVYADKLYIFFWDTSYIRVKYKEENEWKFDTVAKLNSRGSNGDLGFRFRTNGFPQVIFYNNQFYVVYADGNSSDDTDIYLSVGNIGKWTSQKLTEIGFQWQPTISNIEDEIFIGYYEMQDKIRYMGILKQREKLDNFLISNFSWQPIFGVDTSVSFRYMGDYDHSISDKYNFYVTFSGSPNGNPDIFQVTIPR